MNVPLRSKAGEIAAILRRFVVTFLELLHLLIQVAHKG